MHSGREASADVRDRAGAIELGEIADAVGDDDRLRESGVVLQAREQPEGETRLLERLADRVEPFPRRLVRNDDQSGVRDARVSARANPGITISSSRGHVLPATIHVLPAAAIAPGSFTVGGVDSPADLVESRVPRHDDLDRAAAAPPEALRVLLRRSRRWR